MFHKISTNDDTRTHKPLSPFATFCLCRLFPLPFITLGAFFIYFQTHAFYKAHQSRSWPKTIGVLSINVGEYMKSLSYQYFVDGVIYSSDRVIFGELGNRNPSKEWRLVSDLPNASEVRVYYMPQKPEVSTLFTEVREGGWFNLLFGFAFFFSGIIVLIVMPRLLKRRAEQVGRGDGDKPSN